MITRPAARCTYGMYCVAKRCVISSKSYYWQPIGSRIWEIDWYQNEWPWPLFRCRIKVMLTIVSHSMLNTWETVRDRGLVPIQRTTNIKLPMWNRMVTWPITSRDSQKSNSWLQYSQSLENDWRCYLATIANLITADSLLWVSSLRLAIIATAWLLVIACDSIDCKWQLNSIVTLLIAS